MELSDTNFDEYAKYHYKNEYCISIDEFYKDLSRIKYIRTLIKRYIDHGDLKERLILNHIVALGNVFSIESVVKMVFFRLEEEMWPTIKPFLEYLNYMPEVVSIRGYYVHTSDVPIDFNVKDKLNNL